MKTFHEKLSILMTGLTRFSRQVPEFQIFVLFRTCVEVKICLNLVIRFMIAYLAIEMVQR